MTKSIVLDSHASYPDCYAAALAALRDAAVVTGDPEFKRIEAEVKVQWLKRQD